MDHSNNTKITKFVELNNIASLKSFFADHVIRLIVSAFYKVLDIVNEF